MQGTLAPVEAHADPGRGRTSGHAAARGHGKRAVRHQSDVVRAVVGTAILLGAAELARRGEPGVVEVNLFRLVNELPGFLAAPLLGVMQLGALGAVPLVALVALLGRRRRLAHLLLIAGGLAWALARVLQAVVGQDSPEIVLGKVVLHGSAAPGLAFPATHVAVAAAMATVAGPYISRPARRLAWIGVALVGVARIYTGAHFPVDVIGGAALGWALGAVVHVVLGAPRGRASAALVATALAELKPGWTPEVEAELGGAGATRYRVRLADGSRVLAKVVGRDQPEADWLYRAWRLAAFREPEDSAAIVTPAHRVAHEAYLSLLAQREGVNVPALDLTTALGEGERLLARSWVEGRSMATLAPEEVDDALLCRVWLQVARLHAAGVTHGALRVDHVIVDDDGEPWLVELGLGTASGGADDRARDLAELMASLAVTLPPDRVVAAAQEALGPSALAEAVPILQPLTLSTITRHLASRSGTLPGVRAEAARLAGIPLPPCSTPTRVALRNLLPWAGLGFATFVLLPQVGQFQATLAALRHARWGWLVPMTAASAFTYLMAAVALMGASPTPLALGRTWAVQVAAAFTNRLAPAGIGGMGTNIRYLMAAGSDRAGAATAVAVDSVAGFLVHAAAVAVVIPLLGATGGAHRLPSAPDLPDHWQFVVAVLVVLLAAGAAVWGSRARRLASGLRSALTSLRVLVAEPRRAIAVFAGSAGVTAGYTLALIAAIHAFGVGVPTTKVVAVYLGGAALAAVSPTPGGLGALEAALVAGLTGVGAAAGPSVAAVLVYRFVTYWVPVIPGLVLFRRLRHRSLL
jgi:undecaprenyl-diphosphatase